MTNGEPFGILLVLDYKLKFKLLSMFRVFSGVSFGSICSGLNPYDYCDCFVKLELRNVSLNYMLLTLQLI